MNGILGLNILCHFKITRKFKHEMMAEGLSMRIWHFSTPNQYLNIDLKLGVKMQRNSLWCFKIVSRHATKLFAGTQNWVSACPISLGGTSKLVFLC
jgi:hypothetical protein